MQALSKRTKTPIVLVLINGGPLDISFAVNDDRVAAILTAWYPGQVKGPSAKIFVIEEEISKILFLHLNRKEELQSLM